MKDHANQRLVQIYNPRERWERWYGPRTEFPVLQTTPYELDRIALLVALRDLAPRNRSAAGRGLLWIAFACAYISGLLTAVILWG